MRVSLGILMATTVVVAPYRYYRWHYNHAKRLRPVEPGILYRSGQLTAAGFEEALARHQVRTVINLKEEAPDPVLKGGPRESELCRVHGVRHLFLEVELFDPSIQPRPRSACIDQFLAIMDDPANHPVLLHCQAGLHRTGILSAIYRMEYCGWSRDEAIEELKLHGFGDSKCNSSNEYISQYLLNYNTRKQLREEAAGLARQASGPESK